MRDLLALAWLASASQFLVRKTSFSERHRVLFVAGLEGTGHHMWPYVLKASCPEGLCAADAEVSLALFSAGKVPNGHSWELESSVFAVDVGDAARRRAGVATVVAGLRAAALEPRHSLLALNAVGGGGGQCVNASCSGMMSYPNFQGPGRPLHYPDVYRLARWAEEAGADLRVVVMTRNALDTLASTTVHRSFASWEQQSVILTNAVAALKQQLDLVDPRFYACAPFEGFELSPRLAAFVHPSLVGGKFTSRDSRVRRPGDNSTEQHEATERLAAALSTLDAACASTA